MHNLGLLFDVDGPIASPVSRSIAIDSIRHDLVALAAAGVPIAFITGRSDTFIEEQVVRPLLESGLADALSAPEARMFGVFEKGAVWAPITAEGLGEITVDASVAFPLDAVEAVRELVAERYAEWMFFDETKRAMISVEQNHEVASAEYRARQAEFDEAAFEVLAGQGLGMRLRERVSPDAEGAVPFRIDSTIISTDIESVLLDKDRGAQRALEWFEERGALPSRWRSVGDSRSDYKMADYLHARGFETAHVDVRPADGILEKPYRVITEGELIHDEAGAAFLRHWVEQLGL